MFIQGYLTVKFYNHIHSYRHLDLILSKFPLFLYGAAYAWETLFTSIKGMQNLVPEKCLHNLLSSLFKEHLYSGKRDSFSGSQAPFGKS